jgi:hypothetical protein
MVQQLTDYFEYLYSDYISGFRSRHSCETVLLRMVENIKQSLDEGKIVCVLLTDLSRAFDCITYTLLISKLYAYGLSYSACQMLFSYYKDRKQRVKLGPALSEWRNVYKGSAQGSIIGPVSYNIFSNDMLSVLDDDIDVYNYADDNPLVCSGYDYHETQQRLVSNAQKVITWFEQNNMKINPDKFKYIVFGKHDNVESITINNNVILPENSVKILGLTLDKNLQFKEHISTICQKAGNQIHALSRLSNTLNESNKMLLYNSFVECYFSYCSSIWHFCSKQNTYKLEKLQMKALKFITLNFNCSYEELLRKCSKLPLYIIRMHRIIEMVFKINSEMTPKYLGSLTLPKNVKYDLRAENNLCLPSFKTVTYGQKCLKYYGPFYWNQLPNDLKVSMSFINFKQILKIWKPKCTCGCCILCNVLKM